MPATSRTPITMAEQAVDDYTTKVSENTLLKIQTRTTCAVPARRCWNRPEHHQWFIEKHQNDPKLRAKLAEAYLRVAKITDEIGSKEAASCGMRAMPRVCDETR